MNSDWDFETQRADTVWTVQHLIAEKNITEGSVITLEIQTVAAPESGPLARAAYLSALAKENLEADEYEADDGTKTIEVAFPETVFTADAIWACELQVTKVALACGWMPDGWGFWEPDDDD